MIRDSKFPRLPLVIVRGRLYLALLATDVSCFNRCTLLNAQKLAHRVSKHRFSRR